MPPAPEPAETNPWIVQGEDVKSGSLFATIRNDPGVRTGERIGDDVVVLHMSALRARSLQAELPRLVIEQDQALKPPMAP